MAATNDYFSFGEEAIAFLAGSRARGAWCQVACRGEGRPCFANFAVIPAASVGQLDRRIDCLNLRSILGADALNSQDVDPRHGCLPRNDRQGSWAAGAVAHDRATPAYATADQAACRRAKGLALLVVQALGHGSEH